MMNHKKSKNKSNFLENVVGLVILVALVFWFFSGGGVEDQIAELEAEVRVVPISDYDKNLEIYLKLLKLNPDSARYRQKIATYTDNKRIAEGDPFKKADRSLLNLNEAKEYKIIKKMDASLLRTRYVLNISSPEARTFEERAQTVLKAAMDVQNKTGANVVSARLFDYEMIEVLSVALAMARYSGDGRDWSGSGKLRNGNWEVEASAIQITNQQRELVRIWKKNYNKFQIDDELGGTKTDQKQLRNFIGRKLGMTETEVLVAIGELILAGVQTNFWPKD